MKIKIVLFCLLFFIQNAFSVVNPVFWNKLGSDEELATSPLGPIMAPYGTSVYALCAFGGYGYYGDASSAHFAGCGAGMGGGGPVTVGTGKFAMSFFFKPDVADDDGSWNDFRINIAAYGWGVSMAMDFVVKPSLLEVSLWMPDTSYLYYRWDEAVSWNAGDLIHIGLTADSDAGDGNRIQLRFNNGAALVPTVISADFAFSADTFTPELAYDAGLAAGAVIDNIKIYDFAKTDFSWDIANEGLEPEPTPASGPVKTNVYNVNDAAKRHVIHYTNKGTVSSFVISERISTRFAYVSNSATNSPGWNFQWSTNTDPGMSYSSADFGTNNVPVNFIKWVRFKKANVQVNESGNLYYRAAIK